jgi:hypothetical protein
MSQDGREDVGRMEQTRTKVCSFSLLYLRLGLDTIFFQQHEQVDQKPEVKEEKILSLAREVIDLTDDPILAQKAHKGKKPSTPTVIDLT